LLTRTISPPGLIEVYPHPALVLLANAPERLRYKVSKVRSYWPHSTTAERRTLLFQEWARIITLLEAKIRGVANALPMPPDAYGTNLKSYEDMVDAIVCAWVAVCALEGRARRLVTNIPQSGYPAAELLTRAGKRGMGPLSIPSSINLRFWVQFPRFR
jgi:predicted RNase H-like nuclease